MADLSKCLIYGAYGYTGDLIARRAAEQGARPILAGRSATKLAPLVEELGLPQRVFGLDDPKALDAGLEGVDVVIHAAGPFSRTSKPMVDACLRTGTHYLDITGEIDVFEACAARDAEAQAAGVMVMPGVGFDVVPSDCLANYLGDRLPEATHLVLAFASMGGKTSHGTATTMVESLGRPNLVRRDGRITEVRLGKLRRDIDFGRGPQPTVSIPWGDVSTAYSSTGIPNIEVYTAVPRAAQVGARVVGFLGGLLASGPIQRIAQGRVDAGPAGPTDAQRARAHSVFFGEARAGARTVRARLRVPEGYTLTAMASLVIAERVLDGAWAAGYRTPAMMYGADFVLEFDGAERTDL
ncbi:MAG: saccharopine dehydrogenase NADP-binding domain-containing protein [Sandaracinaceae bacterium]|nr:saccharopine dehydrogenase NADP-binding domain-containing protein [Sandaracinaceae bacterium]